MAIILDEQGNPVVVKSKSFTPTDEFSPVASPNLSPAPIKEPEVNPIKAKVEITFPPEQILEIDEAGKVHELTPKELRKQEVLKLITNIKAEHGGAEGNIPMGHDYWKLMNEWRYLNRVD